MVKKSILVRENKRQNTVKKYSLERKNILLNLKKAKSLEEKFNLNEELQKLPRNSSNTRLKNRCWKTGKSRGFFDFLVYAEMPFVNLPIIATYPELLKQAGRSYKEFLKKDKF